jgi:cephalosporin hydroxylase
MMADVSIIIPARNEKYLQQTINSVLEVSELDTEIIVILDGYWPYEPISDHPKVNIIHYTESRGQRQSINAAARIATGKYLMKLDAHCAVAKGFDRILVEGAQPGWTQIPRMYNLDVNTWQPKERKLTDYMYIGWNEKDEMRALYYTGEEYKYWHSRDLMIDETMCCMGPGWFLSKEDFWKQGGCDENHGGWGQQGVEVALKAWLSGGALMVNKHTWFAHWFRGDEGFPYPITGREVSIARKYSMDLWLNDKWPQATRKLQWLVDKFNPPGWENMRFNTEKQLEVNSTMYQHIHSQKREPRWRGVTVIKMPTDLMIYQQVIFENKPRWIIETGTKFGGSSLFFQDMLDLVGEGGHVITIDTDAKVDKPDGRISYLSGNSINRDMVASVKSMVGDDSVMVVLDSNHARKHVKWELYHYASLVTSGQFLVIEDCYGRHSKLYGPGEARDWFLSSTRIGRQFEQTNLDRQFLVGVCMGGWLRRKE